MISALAFPFVHFLCYWRGILGKQGEGERELVIGVWILLLGGVALIQHWVLEKKMGSLWLDRLDLERKLRGSEQDLRLMVERKHAREILSVSEDRFFKAFRLSPDGIAIATLAQGRLVEINDGFERLTGFSRDEVIGRTVSEVGLWPDSETFAEMTRRLEEKESLRDFALEWRQKSGQPCPVRLAVEIIVFADQKCFLATAQVVSRRPKTPMTGGE